MINIAINLNNINCRIQQALATTDRCTKDIILVAASKGQSSGAIRIAYALGQKHFGENYLQEALKKQQELSDLSDICWHFIGPLQSNKARKIAENFDWVHTIDKAKIAEKLNISRQDNQPPLNVCIQVNISKEESKSGLSVQECSDISTAVTALPRLNLRGFMTIPQNNATEAEQRKIFKAMSKLLLKVRDSSPQLTTLDTLSMGMSSDLEAALQEGATIIRVGSAIFGPR
ncbi:MAG: pyridoxal phosphate enzyme (YggS family) [Porticoccus sp.]|jgi:pyridoxal phosphate enzyme (YggS family)